MEGSGILVAVCVVFVFLYMKASAKKVVRFYSDNCGYCVKSKPEWDKFKRNNILNPHISTKDIDVNNEKGQYLLDQYGLKGVPNIIKIEKDLTISQYEGDRSSKDIQKFASNEN